MTMIQQQHLAETLGDLCSKLEDGSIARDELHAMIALQQDLIDSLERRGTALDLELACIGREWLGCLNDVLDAWR